MHEASLKDFLSSKLANALLSLQCEVVLCCLVGNYPLV